MKEPTTWIFVIAVLACAAFVLFGQADDPVNWEAVARAWMTKIGVEPTGVACDPMGFCTVATERGVIGLQCSTSGTCRVSGGVAQ